MSKLSRTILTIGIIGTMALSVPVLAHSFHGDREARHGDHGHMMMARAEGEGGYGHKGRHHERFANMSDEERKAHREQKRVQHMAMRMHWNTLSDAEKENYRVQARMRMDERRAAWEAMSPEEREAKRQEMRERRGGMRGHSHR
ncbi:hypothetical protein [Thioalkalivibrio sulfidiphilus]|uniref:hypothetical protein n=1 Tax=Thioalkalivibrio sulfidiphilus TaxID=1033854 RepID=UPI00035D7113|nr:hypothetical protein [Thioalkalivibrio sulfidiphilus]